MIERKHASGSHRAFMTLKGMDHCTLCASSGSEVHLRYGALLERHDLIQEAHAAWA